MLAMITTKTMMTMVEDGDGGDLEPKAVLLPELEEDEEGDRGGDYQQATHLMVVILHGDHNDDDDEHNDEHDDDDDEHDDDDNDHDDGDNDDDNL